MGETKLMNLAKEFRHIADIEGGKFDRDEIKYYMGGGMYQIQYSYYLSIQHKEIPILFNYEMGVMASGNIYFRMPAKAKHSNFEMSVKHPIMLLLNKQIFPFKIKSKNKELNHFIENMNTMDKLVHVIRNTPFDPIILGKVEENELVINTSFHIQFEERMEIIRPMLAFYKELIDFMYNQN